MNKAKLKTYAPQARKDFIAAVTARAHRIGLAEKNGSVAVAPAEKSGDFVIIAGQSWPAKINRQRDNLIARIDQDGFSQTMEAVAYTWFNRFAALRYMEIHDYLSHGYRVLSSREGGLPEILNAAPELAQSRELPDLNPQQVIELKLAGDQDGELYRLTLIAQCNALSSVMPFLFERIDNETELLLPDNLLLTDSVIAKLVAAIPEEDWQEVEIIGWLYQFYISEKKDQVIGKVVKSEDIPAATQLFTPNWIVQYLVQNSVGRLWSMANPASTLKSQWLYYIEPAEQTEEVGTALAALTQARMDEDGGSLNPETITVLDPACGSGHILAEAYDVLKAIYLERGYRMRDIPRLILEKNLYGLDIDDRAAQLAGFALLMKARADDRRLLDNPPKLNVYPIQSSKNLHLPQLWQQLDLNRQSKIGTTSSLFEEPQTDLTQAVDDSHYQLIKNTLALFEQAETLGSLIQVPTEHFEPLQDLLAQCQTLAIQGDSFQKSAATTLLPFIRQAVVLAMQFDAVVANPPYMGGKGMNPALKDFAKRTFPDSKSDLFAMFIERGFEWCKPTGFNAMVTMQSWMFLSSFEKMRKKLLTSRTISSLLQVGYNSFPEMNSKIAQACAFSVIATNIQCFTGRYIDLNSAPQSADKNQIFLERIKKLVHDVCQDNFKKISGSPVAYWLKASALLAFEKNLSLSSIADPKAGLATGDNTKFQRLWFEVSLDNIEFNCSDCLQSKEFLTKWYPCHSGGSYRKWYGNHEVVVNWQNDGREIRDFKHADGRQKSRPQNTQYFFKQGLTWTKLSSTYFAARFRPSGFVFDDTGRSAFCDDKGYELPILAAINSVAGQYFLSILNPTLSFTSSDVGNIPISPEIKNFDTKIPTRLIELHKTDWNNYETSWDFTENPLIRQKQNTPAATISPVIPAWMPESSHRDVNLSAYTSAQSSIGANATLPSMALDSGIHAGMTALSNVGWVSDSVTQQTETTDVGLRDKAANPTYPSNNLDTVPTYQDSSLYTRDFKPVIPAGMPEPLDRASESSHRESVARVLKLSAYTSAQSSIGANATLPSMALDSGIPAGMTALSNVGWISDSVTQQTETTDVGLRDKAANPTYASNNLEHCFNQWQTQTRNAIAQMQRLEEENNRLFIAAYGLQDELSPDVPEEQITLARADREKDCQRLISYAIGCMMGRYRLDRPGLIYAHAGNVDFDKIYHGVGANSFAQLIDDATGRINSPLQNLFPADADGIVPITDEFWFEDDAANRIREFLLAVWDNPAPQGEGVEANIAWLAESLGSKNNETPQETIRRYLATSFYKNHLQTYKKRPIYWLFTSGKQGAFQALVYLHRYHESTLARMRAEYVVPLTGKIQSRIEMLEKDAAVAASNATRSKLNKDIEKLKKKHVELLSYDEKLRHYADQRIQLDLDDGVKVNYGKFGDLLAEVKAVAGGTGDD